VCAVCPATATLTGNDACESRPPSGAGWPVGTG
jgi:hypothetical protein